MSDFVYKIRHIPTGKFLQKKLGNSGSSYSFTDKGKIWSIKPTILSSLQVGHSDVKKSDFEIVKFKLIPCE